MFERLFGEGSNAAERSTRKQAQASLLDAVTNEVARLNKTPPGTDRSRLNEYLDDIREIERRLKNVVQSQRPVARCAGALRHARIFPANTSI